MQEDYLLPNDVGVTRHPGEGDWATAKNSVASHAKDLCPSHARTGNLAARYGPLEGRHGEHPTDSSPISITNEESLTASIAQGLHSPVILWEQAILYVEKS